MFSCSKNTPAPTDAGPAVTREGEASSKAAGRFLSGRAVVKFEEAMTAVVERDLDAAATELGVYSMRRVFPPAGEYEERTRREGLHRYYVVEFDKKIQATKAIEDLQAIPGIEKAEGLMKVRRREFNDPFLSRQWNLVNHGGKRSFTSGADIGVESVWERNITGNESVIVAVVDGGIALNHNDLADNAVPAGPGGSRNFVKNSYSIEVDDHGTHVAGAIAAISNNSLGVAGIAGGDYANGVKGCKVMSCQIFNDDDYDDNNGSEATCAAGIKWGADHGALISQNSWGYYADMNDDGNVSQDEYDELNSFTVPSVIKEAIAYFVKYAGCDNAGNQKTDSMMKGGVVFFAAGNEDIDIDPISQQCDVLSVGAFGPDGRKAYYSNYGDWVDIAAPGGNAYISGGMIYSLVGGNKYEYLQGTSMACPQASGVAALVISAEGGPGFTNTQLVAKLLKSTPSVDIAATGIGHKIDAAGAIAYASSNKPPVIAVADGAVREFRAWQTVDVPLVVSDPDGDAVTVTVEGSGAEEVLCLEDGSFILRITGAAVPAGNYVATLTATDEPGDQASADFAYTILENNPPAVARNFSNIISGSIGQIFSFNIEDYFTDPDEEPLSYKVSLTDDDVASGLVSNNTLYVTSVEYGLTRVTVTASDALGATASADFNMLVRDGDGSGIDAYPNPVSRTLYVRTGEEDLPTAVRIVSATGSVVYDEVKTFSAFNPLQVDMSRCAPGVYNLKVTLRGTTHTKSIVKK